MKANILKVLIILVEVFAVYCESPIFVKTQYGKIAGYRYNEEINAFPGVPYAKPPVAEWRFEPARKIEFLHNEQGNDNTAYDGSTHENVMCPQISILTGEPQIIGQEDCLILNIYAPSKKTNAKLPVMIYIHGGGFAWGTGVIFKPDYLLRGQDVILVTINYRLGPFGFLTAGVTGDDKIYGNIGLKDQQMAIQWVHDNIEHFNGDPARVTLFGNSAGGASSHLHLFSPKSKGLFHNVIIQSGAANCHWAIKDHQKSLQLTREFARLNDCPISPNEDMISCLKTKSLDDLMTNLNKFQVLDADPMVVFSPTIEPQHNNAFLTDTIENLLKKGQFADVPIIEGTTPEEGAIRTALFAVHKESLQKFNKHFDEIFKISSFHNEMSTKNVQKIRKQYFGNEEISEANIGKITKLITDAFFVCVDGALDIHRKYSKSPIYSYLLKYQGTLSFSRVFSGDENTDLGVCHMDELFYLFPLEFFFEHHQNKRSFNENDFKMSEIMVKLWVYFATNNNLKNLHKTMDIDWQPVTSENNEHLVIDNEIKMGTNAFDPKIKQFWKHITSINNKQNFSKDEL